MVIEYNVLSNEIINLLEDTESIVLATSINNKVTARTMSHVNVGLTILFQTGNNSEKARQIRENPNVAFAIQNMQMEAVAEIHGHPLDNPLFIEKYKTKFPNYFDKYTNQTDEILVIARPTKITLYKYIDGKPYRDIMLVNEKIAYRE